MPSGWRLRSHVQWKFDSCIKCKSVYKHAQRTECSPTVFVRDVLASHQSIRQAPTGATTAGAATLHTPVCRSHTRGTGKKDEETQKTNMCCHSPRTSLSLSSASRSTDSVMLCATCHSNTNFKCRAQYQIRSMRRQYCESSVVALATLRARCKPTVSRYMLPRQRAPYMSGPEDEDTRPQPPKNILLAITPVKSRVGETA